MNDKKFLIDNDAEQAQEERISHRKVYSAILAAVICIALALAVWVGVMNTQDTDYIPVRLVGPEGYRCHVSVDGVEVKGRVSDLRNLDEIVIELDEQEALRILFPGGGKADAEDYLKLPDGVTIAGDLNAVITVSKSYHNAE